MNTIMFSAFILYFFILLSIAFYHSRKIRMASNSIIGSRSINYWVTAFATQSSDMGCWLFLAFPAAVYTEGLFEIWTAIGLVFFMFLNWHCIAPRLRTTSEQTNSHTLSELFEKQFSDTTGLINLASSLFILIFFTFYISAGIVALGLLFKSTFAMSYHSGIVIGICTAMLYTLIGTFFTTGWCQLFQGLFLLLMIIAIPAVAFCNVSGISAIINAYQSHIFQYSFMHNIPHGLLLAAGWGLGYFGQPHILVNFISIDDPKKLNSAKLVGLTGQIIVLSAAIIIGLIALAFFPTPVANPELIYILITKSLFNPFIAGVALCAIFSATLSNMNRHILVASSVIASDSYKKTIFTQRITSVIVLLFALYVAWTENSTIYGLVHYAWSGLGSAFGPLVIAALYSKNITHQGALAGLIIGGTTAALWPFANTTISPLIPGFMCNIITLYGVSWMTRNPLPSIFFTR